MTYFLDARTWAQEQFGNTNLAYKRRAKRLVEVASRMTATADSVLFYNDHGDLIRARLTPNGYQDISRARVLEPPATWGRKCAWAAPAFANRHVYARTDKELVCASLANEP